MARHARLLTNAVIRTPDDAPPGHDSVAIVDGTITAIGTRADAEAALPADHEVTDVAGHTLAPGFIDAHIHPLPMCFFEHHEDLGARTSLDDVFDQLADRAAREPADGWVVGFGLDDERLAEARLPTRTELDRVGGGRPVALLRRDGHHAVGSTAALAAAGFGDDTPDPDGGVIHRAADGTLSGLCGERAAAMVMAGVPLPEMDAFESALDRIVDRFARAGVTAISAMCQTSDEGPSGEAGTLEWAAWAMLIDRMPFDVQTILIAPTMDQVTELRAGPLHRPDADRRLDAVKLFLDGTLGGHTACMHAPYADGDAAGMLTLDPDAAWTRMRDAHLAGLQICVHAIGDRANATAAELFTRLYAEHPADPDEHRHRVEHASVLDDATIDTLGTLGVAAVVQPVSLASEAHWLAKRLGPQRIGNVYPYRGLLDAGVTVAGSSDAPIESIDVLDAMRCAVDRSGIAPRQAITPREAVGLYTTGGARVRAAEHRVGRLAPGLRADIVELHGDPTRTLDDVTVTATICAGVDRFRDASR